MVAHIELNRICAVDASLTEKSRLLDRHSIKDHETKYIHSHRTSGSSASAACAIQNQSGYAYSEGISVKPGEAGFNITR